MENLSKLFGSLNKVKIMRLFLLNPDLILSNQEVASRGRIGRSNVSRELNLLGSIGFIGKRSKGKLKGWQLDQSFPFSSQLKAILKNDLVARKGELVRQFKGCGKINLLIISGIFIENTDSRADLLIVGQGLKKKSIERIVHGLEAEIGKELVYAVLETPDFHYRLNACDKFVRDVLDYPHERLIDKLGV